MGLRQKILFWGGLAVYAASFFLTAVVANGVFGSTSRGYECAQLTFLGPWHGRQDAGLAEYIAIIVSGWINPVFLAAVILRLGGWHRKVFAVLRIAVVAMMPFCWLVFHYDELRPREGYFLWTAGMLMVLFAGGFTSRERNAAADPSAMNAPG